MNHAFVISEGLRRKKVPHLLWHIPDFPTRQKASIWVTPGQVEWELNWPGGAFKGGTKPPVVWLRRPGRPVLPDEIEQPDREFGYRECSAFIDCLRQFLGEDAFWVNPPGGASRANLKLKQLRSAAESGFNIPATLMSNDPGQIRKFIQTHQSTIYKTFFPFSWRTSQGFATVFCSPVSIDDLPEDGILSSVPGIYQASVPKAYELRVTAIGDHLFAAKLDSQSVAAARSDWRAAAQSVPVEPTSLPSPVAQACRAVLRDLGIVFGCFDLIVTPHGDYFFLEVNESGAFLWLEEQNPDFCLADAFCEFLRQGRVDYTLSDKTSRVHLAEIQPSALRQMELEAPLVHVREARQIYPDQIDR